MLGLAGSWVCAPAQSPTQEPIPVTEGKPSHLVILDPEVVVTAGIEVAGVELGRLPRKLSVPGRIGVNEDRTVRVGSIASGRVSKVLAGVGDRVNEGNHLAEIQSQEVDDLRAEYAKAIAELEHSRAEVDFWQKGRDRSARLYALKAGSLDNVRSSEAELLRAQTSVQIAQAELGRLEERLEHLGLTMEGAVEEYLTPRAPTSGEYEHVEAIPVVSPQSGTILERLVTPGTVVSPSADLFVVSDLTTLWVHAEVPEKNLAYLKEGQSAEIVVEAYPERKFPGRLAYVADVLNPATRTVQVRCEARNPAGLLRPEMYATISFDLGEDEEAILVPRGALQTVEERSVVFIAEGSSTFRVTPVRTGRAEGELVSVLEGLSRGEQVAIKGSFLLKSEFLKRQLSEE
jgi:cobalt-zinc-cadmium efflux system membrane fusion protein